MMSDNPEDGESWDFNIMMDIREIYWKDEKQWRKEFF
jgi:hypothetical protein